MVDSISVGGGAPGPKPLVLTPLSVLTSTIHGRGKVLFSAHPTLPLCASCGQSKVIQISSTLPPGNDDEGRNHIQESTVIDQIIPPSPTPVVKLSWSKDGMYLAAFQSQSSQVTLWELNERKSRSVDTYTKDLVWIEFGPDCFAVGTGKGAVNIFSLKDGKKMAVIQPNPSRPKMKELYRSE